MNELSLGKVTDLFINKNRRTDGGVWIEVVARDMNGVLFKVGFWGVEEKSIDVHIGE